jgi:NADP-dependent 3-hydroxy acid dehydrogenase YdfG
VAGFESLGAVVVGAGSGVGRAIALALAKHGATVAFAGRNVDRLAAARDEAGSGLVCPVDIARKEQVVAFAADIRGRLPGIDMLVHSAGVIEIDPVAAAQLDDFDLQYRTNLRGPYELTQLLLPTLRSRKGQVVFINSTAGRAAAGSMSSQYAATKAGLRAVADSLRAEVNEQGIRVLSVFLGRTATPLQARLTAREGGTYRPDLLVQPEDVAEVVVAALSLPRTAEVTEVTLRPMSKPE